MESVPLAAQVTVAGPTSASSETPGSQGSPCHRSEFKKMSFKSLEFLFKKILGGGEGKEMAQQL